MTIVVKLLYHSSHSGTIVGCHVCRPQVARRPSAKELLNDTWHLGALRWVLGGWDLHGTLIAKG